MKKLFISVIVLFVAIVLTILIAPFGVLYGIIKSIYKMTFIEYLTKILRKISVCIDQMDNVLCGDFLDDFFTKKGKNFGLEDDTISEVLSKNRDKNITRFGRIIKDILEAIDPGHLDKALEENIF